ncbi:MAG: TlpA family protein disulfide reductase [Flavobacteriales bacterium]
MHRLIWVFIFIFFAHDFFGAKTIITGKAQGQSGFQIAAFSPADYISGKRDLLALVTIGDKDDFRLEFELGETRLVQLVVLHMEAVLYAEPGKEYKVIYQPVPRDEAKRFDKTEVSLVFEGLPDGDINFLMSRFDSEYTAFINEHFYDFAIDEFKGNPEFSGKMKGKSKVDLYEGVGKSDSLKQATVSNFSEVVVAFFDKINKEYATEYQNEFFHDYVRYSLSEIELVSGLSRKRYYKDYFMSQKVLHSNPAYMRVFKMFYRNLFDEQSEEKKSGIIKNINTLHDAIKLIDLFEGDSTMLSRDIRALAVIQALKDNFYNKTYSRRGITKTLASFTANYPDKEIQKIGLGVSQVLEKNREGWIQEDFVLLDGANDKWNLRETEGLPTYVIFFATWSSSSVKEMLVLEKLNETYGKDIHIVGICMDENAELFKKYQREHPKQNFTMLYGYGDILLKEKFSLKSLPHAVLLDSEQKVITDYTALPSQGIQATFAKIQEQAKAGGQGPGTWKGKE